VDRSGDSLPNDVDALRAVALNALAERDAALEVSRNFRTLILG
jgi:hypothetical protein